jgi:hypothetical protein
MAAVIRTNEELMIAMDTAEIAGALRDASAEPRADPARNDRRFVA